MLISAAFNVILDPGGALLKVSIDNKLHSYCWLALSCFTLKGSDSAPPPQASIQHFKHIHKSKKLEKVPFNLMSTNHPRWPFPDVMFFFNTTQRGEEPCVFTSPLQSFESGVTVIWVGAFMLCFQPSFSHRSHHWEGENSSLKWQWNSRGS